MTGLGMVIDFTFDAARNWAGLIVSLFAIVAGLYASARVVTKCFTDLGDRVGEVKHTVEQEALHAHFRHEANLTRFASLENNLAHLAGEVESHEEAMQGLRSTVDKNTTRLDDLRDRRRE